jgi:hypothetical protein
VHEVGSVGLTWTVSTGATGYNVKRALNSGGPYTTIGTSAFANYNDLTALDTNRYYYVVSATNASGESANSASFGVIPLVPSSAKNILTFVFPGLPVAVISGTNINLTVAAGTPVTALAPTYTVSPWATGSPASGTSRNFSTPQTYTITAADSSTQTYTVTVTVAPPPLTYNFNDATLQGWNNRVWNGSAWIDLAPNATTYAGTLLPASGNNGLFVPLNGSVWVNGSTDNHLNTLWLRSPQFHLNGTGDLTVQLAKGIAKTTAPANDLAVPFAAIDGGGWKGVALRRVSDGVFVLNKPRDVGNDDTLRTVTFTQAELATLDFNAAYTLELINSDRGGWGWLTMDNVSIPGTAVVALSSTTLTSSLGATGTYSSAVTFTATVAVTGGPATGTVTFKDGATVLGTGTLASGTATFTTSTLGIGAHSITASYEGDAAFATSVSSVFGYSVTAAPGYETWATNGAQGLTPGVNDDPSADPDGDGISNLMEFALGGVPMVSTAAILPTFTNPGANWVFEYNRSDTAHPSTTQVVEYGNYLTGWTPVIIPATSGGMVEITPGSPSDHVKVTIPTLGSQTFVRLKVSK